MSVCKYITYRTALFWKVSKPVSVLYHIMNLLFPEVNIFVVNRFIWNVLAFLLLFHLACSFMSTKTYRTLFKMYSYSIIPYLGGQVVKAIGSPGCENHHWETGRLWARIPLLAWVGLGFFIQGRNGFPWPKMFLIYFPPNKIILWKMVVTRGKKTCLSRLATY